MAVEDIGFFPSPTRRPGQHTGHQDKTDGLFVAVGRHDPRFAWTANEPLLTHAETWLNEIKLERDGRYLGLTGGGPPVSGLDLARIPSGRVQSIGRGAASSTSQNAGCRSMWNVGQPRSHLRARRGRERRPDRQDAISTSAPPVGTSIMPGTGFRPTRAGGRLDAQWFLSRWERRGRLERQLQWNSSGGERNDGSDARSWPITTDQYQLLGLPVRRRARMQGGDLQLEHERSCRYDLFIAEVPLR